MNLWGIVVAAGSGTRFGRPKHTAPLGGLPLWERARSSLLGAGVTDVVIVGEVPGGVPGGSRRRDSVRAGIAALTADADYVLVHDAARPLASAELGRRVAERLAEGDIDAVVPTVPVTDAVKSIRADGSIASVDRGGLHLAQTPQGFRVAALVAAQDAEADDAADDAELIERWGGTVAIVKGEPTNFKITYVSDLVIAEALLGAQ